MFLGREDYLSELGGLWRKSIPSLVTCRGRRRIGKSTLIEEFAHRSKANLIEISGEAPHSGMTERDQLLSFSRQLSEQCELPFCEYSCWHDALYALDSAIDNKKTVVLLDEISWMGHYSPDFPGELKNAWDMRFKRHSQLIVILCGSVSTWIQKNILNNTGFVGRASLNLVVRELPLSCCSKFWGKIGERLAPREILDVLSVTGGVPRYLEEIDPSQSACENIRRLCFTPHGALRNDFDQIFNSVFGLNALTKRKILSALSLKPMTVSELCDELYDERGGTTSTHLEELSVAGFISADSGLNPSTGRPARARRYRITDNYTRFYLRYILPNESLIEHNGFQLNSLESLPGWESIMGLQFENLVCNNLQSLLPKLGLEHVLLKSAAPWLQKPTSRNKGCQIDLLLQNDRMVYIVEIKRRNHIGHEAEEEVAAKVRALNIPKDKSIRTALIYEGHLAPVVQADGYFDALLPIEELMR